MKLKHIVRESKRMIHGPFIIDNSVLDKTMQTNRKIERRSKKM